MRFPVLGVATLVALLVGASAAGADVPVNLTPPVIQGDGVVGHPQTLTSGTWSGDVTIVTDTWEECQAASQGCMDLGPFVPFYPVDMGACSGAAPGVVVVVEQARGPDGDSAPVSSAPITLTRASARSARFEPFIPCWEPAGVEATGQAGIAAIAAQIAAQQAAAAKALAAAALAQAIRTHHIPLDLHTVLLHAPRITFVAPAAGVAVAAWRARDPATRLWIAIARGSVTFSAPGSASIALRVTPAGRLLLKRAKRVHVIETGSFAATGAGALTATASLDLAR